MVSTYKEAVLPAGFERIGFIYPVYSGLPPRSIMKFVEQADFSLNPRAYYFQVVSYGGSTGNTSHWMRTHLSSKGIQLSASFAVANKPNYIVSYPISKNNTGKPQKAAEMAEKVGEKVRAKEKTKLQKSPVKLFAIMNQHIASKFAEMDKNYIVSEQCTGCGICSKVCPVENIQMVHGKPAFKHNCEQCMACIHNCPKQALNYKAVTVKRNRYRNPNVTLQELFRK